MLSMLSADNFLPLCIATKCKAHAIPAKTTRTIDPTTEPITTAEAEASLVLETRLLVSL